MPSALTTYWVGPTIRPLTVEAKSMLLYFRSADLWGELAARLCRALRQQGILLCCPGDALEPEALVPLPFTAALLHFDRFPDGLPHPDALRACFPGLPLIAVSETEPDSSRFRAIPGTDYELTGRAVPSEITALLARLRAGQNCHPAARCGLLLPSDHRCAMVLVHPIAFTRNEYTLIRVLAEVDEILSPAQLAAFLARPGERFSTASVPVHICSINRKVKACGAPNLVGCRRYSGYSLCPPYSGRLPAARVVYNAPVSWGN